MYNGNNPIALRSREWLYQAFLSLLETEGYRQTTITAICAKADLSRQTFYQLFGSKEEILSYHFDRLCDEFLTTLPGDPVDSQALNLHFFSFFYRHRDFLQILSTNNLSHLLEEQIERHFHQFPTARRLAERSGYAGYFIAYLSGAMTQLLQHWAAQGYDLSPEEISAFCVHIGLGNMSLPEE